MTPRQPDVTCPTCNGSGLTLVQRKADTRTGQAARYERCPTCKGKGRVGK